MATCSANLFSIVSSLIFHIGVFSLADKIFVFLAVDLEFEAPLKIVEYPDPILRAKNKRIGSFDDNLKKLVQEMFDVMYK